MAGIKRDGILISDEHLPKKRLPTLTVKFDDDDQIYKVATFKDEITAKWFVDIMEVVFKGIEIERR